MPNEQNDTADRVPELPATETSDDVAAQVKGGATGSSGSPTQQPPAPRPIDNPRAIIPCY